HEITITVNDDETVTKLQVEDKNADLIKVDGKNRYETFKVNDISSELNAYAEYQAPYQGGVFESDADFRISLDSKSLKKAKEEDSKPEEDNKTEEDNKPEEDSKPVNTEEDIDSDKTYEIDYTIKHEDGVNESVANNFFTNKGILLEKDDKTYVQMTITSGDM